MLTTKTNMQFSPTLVWGHVLADPRIQSLEDPITGAQCAKEIYAETIRPFTQTAARPNNGRPCRLLL